MAILWRLLFCVGALELVALVELVPDETIVFDEVSPGKSEDHAASDPSDPEDVDDEDEEQEHNHDASSEPEHLHPGRMKGLHSKIDKDGDGKVSMAEITEFWRATRKTISHKDSDMLMEMMDGNRDGVVSLNEITGQESAEAPKALPTKPAAWDEKEDGEWQSPTKDVDLHLHEGMAARKATQDLEIAKFNAADHNKDGVLDKHELPDHVFPHTHDVILEVLAAHTLKTKDKDGDGELEPNEFREELNFDLKLERGDLETEEENKTFQKLDKDQSGKLNLQELLAWESGTHDMHKAMDVVFEIADDDKDGHISIEELEKHLLELTGSGAADHFNEWGAHHEL